MKSKNLIISRIYENESNNMKKTVMIICLLTYGLWATDAVEAAKNLGVESNYTEAIGKAKKEDKMLVMVIVKKNCRWCDKIVNRTLSDMKVKKELNAFVTLIIDKDAAYPADFKENFFPSIFFIDQRTEKSVYENVGYIGTKCFINDLHESLRTRKSLYTSEES